MENVEPIIEEINKITNFEYQFSLKSATLFEDADFCVIEIFYRDGVILNKATKETVESKILSLAPTSFRYEIKLIKKFISEEQVKSDILNYMKTNFNSITFEVAQVVSNELNFEIKLKIDTLAYNHAIKKKLSKQIEKYLKNLYKDHSFVCELENEKIIIEQPEKYIEPEPEADDIMNKRKIIYTDSVSIIGKVFDTPAMYIMDIDKEMNDIIICGTIKSINKNAIKKKSIENNFQNENDIEENIKGKYLYKFELEDFTKQISCIVIPNKDSVSKIDLVKVGDTVSLKGFTKLNNLNHKLTFNINEIEYCKLPETFEEYIEYKKEKSYYEFVKPEQIVVYKQADLMTFADAEVIPEYLQNKTFVCYDLETTGLHYESGDKMVEIGAIKIVNGKITEKFVSFVNPDGKHIDKGASETTGIYDIDVVNAPKDYEVLQDFYKFTRGAIIIGYNIVNFDNAFLIGQGRKCRYNFDNPIEDVYRLAQMYVRDVKNYKLTTVAEKLGVKLDKAHSAVFDALATAEVFIKIAESM